MSDIDVSVASAYAVAAKKPFFQRGLTPQRNSTVGSFVSGERVSGRSLSKWNITNFTSTTNLEVLAVGASQQGSGNFVTPGNIDGERLTPMEQCFAWYAIRYACFEYCPRVGSTTAGQFALGLTNSLGVTTGSTSDLTSINSMAEILGLQFADMFAPWRPQCLEYAYNGDKLYATTNNTGYYVTDSDYNQGLIMGWADGAAPSSNTLWGTLMIDYVIDFYEALPATTRTVTLGVSPREQFLARELEKLRRLKQTDCDDHKTTALATKTSSTETPEYVLVRTSEIPRPVEVSASWHAVPGLVTQTPHSSAR